MCKERGENMFEKSGYQRCQAINQCHYKREKNE